MHVGEALERLDLIHDQLAKAEIYRGFRVKAVFAVGIVALAAAAFQPFVTVISFVPYWVAVAGVCAVLGMAAATHSYLHREDEFCRRRTRRVMAQFLPCLVAGGAVTAGFARLPDLVVLLPGMWAILFGLGVIAARPHLPAPIAWVGLGYILGGSVLILHATIGTEPNPWTVGGIFGVGHLMTAVILWRGTLSDAEGGTNE